MKSQKDINLANDLDARDRQDIYRNFLLYCMSGNVVALPMGASGDPQSWLPLLSTWLAYSAARHEQGCPWGHFSGWPASVHSSPTLCFLLGPCPCVDWGTFWASRLRVSSLCAKVYWAACHSGSSMVPLH